MAPRTARRDRLDALDALVGQLAEFSTSRARVSFLRRHKEFRDPAVVEHLYARVVRLARIDLKQADRLAQAAKWVADRLADDGSRAQSLRATGHVLFIRGKYKEATEQYNRAVKLFRRAGREVDVARTLNGALQSLISLGKYGEALEWAAQARVLFERHGIALGLARLDSNVANILYRQDRFDDALALYDRAYQQLSTSGEPQDVAAVLSNTAVCYINLNDFDKALATYDSARTFCESHEMPLLVVQADYNIAYLYYLRGEYTRALDLYRTAQEQSDRAGDAYHSALCDLDRSEMYLELNLSEEAGELAERALARFGELRMVYEEAKAVTNLALATSRHGDMRRARKLFARARQLFGRERNHVWLALVDFYEASVLHRDGQHVRARRLAENARDLFARASVPARAAFCDLLLARLELQAGRLQAADKACRAATAGTAGTETPILAYQSHFVLGLVQEARGEPNAALEEFRKAHGALEQLRSRLRGDDLKIAFLQDKQAVYESLVFTSLALGPTRRKLESAFGYIENAKSRSLADLIAFRAASLAPRVAGRTTDAVPKLRQELNWHYRQLELEEARHERGSARRTESLRHRAHALEKQLGRSLDELRRTDEEFSTLQSGSSFGVDEIRSSLGTDTVLLEYYEARGQLYVCVLGQDMFDIVPLGPIAEVRDHMRLLQFQLSKFRLGPAFVGAFGEQLQAATEAHLRDLYAALIAPVRHRLQAAHLVVVPHDVLHFLPFHALLDGERYLIDEFSLSYAPSSTVYRLCWAKPAKSTGRALIMGVPDASTPFIAEEVRAVASVLPHPRVFLGPEATVDQLQRHGAESRFVHVATHGLFRRDNPMFSSIRLGDGPLSVYDLYELRLPAELVTLSGCGTGLSVVVGGDEQLGLVRGLLYAGARAVLLTLWDVDDSSTAAFMKEFYGRLQNGWSKARAVQEGMRELRERSPHPFFWAPFTLIGNIEAS
jgi:tetratricopeptide (TPR) repeat protein